MGLFFENGIGYSGAGVMVIEDYYKKDHSSNSLKSIEPDVNQIEPNVNQIEPFLNKKIEPCIVLLRNRSTGIFSEMGGIYEKKHQNLVKTAITELREESRNLFNLVCLENALTQYTDIPVDSHTYYRVYFVKINGSSTKYFTHNMQILDQSSDTPIYWKETDQLAHVPINQLIDLDLNKKGVKVKTVNGEEIKLSRRTRKVIRYGFDNIMNIVKEPPLLSRKDLKLFDHNVKNFDKYPTFLLNTMMISADCDKML